jgi:hypothetical protein
MVWPHGNIDCVACMGQKRNEYWFWWETLNEREHLKESNTEEDYNKTFISQNTVI